MRMNGKVFLLFLFVPLISHAQFGGGEELAVTLTPERPGALTTVTIDVESYIADLSRSNIRWELNGAVMREGIGEKRFSFRSGALGSAANLIITAETLDGRVFQKDLSLRPAEVTLLWQSASYTPPFYRGKALFPFQGIVTVAATPFFVDERGARYDARELVYTWREDGKVIGDASGYGNALFAFRGAVPMREKVISVEVGTPDETLLAGAEITIPPIAPRLLLYENHPLYGIRFNRALASPYALDSDEVQLSAVPFFFETPERASRGIAYGWSANYAALPNENGPAITLRRATGRGGEAVVSLSARHEKQSFQGDEADLTIRFSERPTIGGTTAP